MREKETGVGWIYSALDEGGGEEATGVTECADLLFHIRPFQPFQSSVRTERTPRNLEAIYHFHSTFFPLSKATAFAFFLFSTIRLLFFLPRLNIQSLQLNVPSCQQQNKSEKKKKNSKKSSSRKTTK